MQQTDSAPLRMNETAFFLGNNHTSSTLAAASATGVSLPLLLILSKHHSGVNSIQASAGVSFG